MCIASHVPVTMCTKMQVPVEARRGCWSSWTWSCSWRDTPQGAENQTLDLWNSSTCS